MFAILEGKKFIKTFTCLFPSYIYFKGQKFNARMLPLANQFLY